jgi:hypothetical protein
MTFAGERLGAATAAAGARCAEGAPHESAHFDPATSIRQPYDDAGGRMKRRYTMDQYRADVARLHTPSREAPRVDGALAEALAEGADLLPPEETPQESAVKSCPPPPAGGFVPRWSGLRQRVRRGTP